MPNDGHSGTGQGNLNQNLQTSSNSDQLSERDKSAESMVPTIQLELKPAHLSRDPMRLPSGELYGDFFIRNELGRGSFGVVYLAEQLSLKRTVALKVTDSTRDDGCNSEGETMAQLEHPSIVRVFSQSTDELNRRRLLCMQYVSGMNLRKLINITRQQFGEHWQGRHLLKILEHESENEDAVLRETSLADRETLSRADKLEAVCWIGAETAFALNHAHQAGYIHRDVKPENTIINRFGRPMLVDFNLAMDSEFQENRPAGGTVPYMSPESIQAFTSDDNRSTANEFDADVYALGVTLWELASGCMPFKSFGGDAFNDPDELSELLKSRAAQPEQDQPIDPLLGSILMRAFHYQPNLRFRSASEFGETLQGVAQQAKVLEARSTDSWLGRSVVKRPIPWLVIAAILPHIVASVLQIAYNQAEIVSRLTAPATALFYWLIFWANPIIYGVCGILVLRVLFRVLKPWFLMKRREAVGDDEMETIRTKLLLTPRLLATIGVAGWLVGAVVFPGIIYFQYPEKFTLEVWMHFFCSFAISGAIAVTFSYAFSLAVVVYGLYPTYFSTPFRFADKAKKQLGPIRAKWARLASIAGMIPLAAAILVVAFFEPDEFREVSGREFAFKSLVVGLILASVLGFALVRYNGRAVKRLMDRCMGGK